jgi:hypothetical protein
MKRRERPSDNPVSRMEPHGRRPLHGSATSPGMPNLAGAQIPGPGTAHIYAGEDGRLPDAAADPWEQEGHRGSEGGGLFSRLLRRLGLHRG